MVAHLRSNHDDVGTSFASDSFDPFSILCLFPTPSVWLDFNLPSRTLKKTFLTLFELLSPSLKLSPSLPHSLCPSLTLSHTHTLSLALSFSLVFPWLGLSDVYYRYRFSFLASSSFKERCYEHFFRPFFKWPDFRICSKLLLIILFSLFYSKLVNIII